MDLKRVGEIGFDAVLIVVLTAALLGKLAGLPISEPVFIFLGLIGLLPVGRSALLAIINKHLTIDLLASVALIFAYIAGEWTSAAFINLMLAFARVFDHWTQIHTRDIISHLLKYRPAKVKIKDGEHVKEVALESVKVGDLVLVETGERVPVDGTVTSGHASIDESTLTGESLPVAKKENSRVFSSTLNVAGSLIVKVEKVGADSTLEKIIGLVSEASRRKSPTERVADKFTAAYIFLMLVGSLTLYLLTGNLTLVLAVLLVVCADDIAVAVPLTFTSAIILGARRGIIIKGSDVLEKLPKIRYFLTDKTGTLTRGRPEIFEIKYFGKGDKDNFLEKLGAAAITSKHPVDQAIVDYLKRKHIHLDAPEKFNETPGEGVTAYLGKNKIVVGRKEYLEERKIKVGDAGEYQTKGYGVTFVAINNKYAGLVAYADEVRPYAREVVADTKKLGVKKWLLLTGDNDKVAGRIAAETKMDEFKAGLKPEDKLKILEELKKGRGEVAMVGDGVNDAATLAQADVSFAMGAIGADTSIEAADVALMKDRLERIPEAIILGRKTRRVVWQCFISWAITNLAGLYLVFAGWLNPSGAAAFNFLTDFIPIFIALRVNTFNLSVYNNKNETHPY